MIPTVCYSHQRQERIHRTIFHNGRWPVAVALSITRPTNMSLRIRNFHSANQFGKTRKAEQQPHIPNRAHNIFCEQWVNNANMIWEMRQDSRRLAAKYNHGLKKVALYLSDLSLSWFLPQKNKVTAAKPSA